MMITIDGGNFDEHSIYYYEGNCNDDDDNHEDDNDGYKFGDNEYNNVDDGYVATA
ncbi:hypothetical protein DPMN_138327 [Dreissena polymorpha]|uniref:Uncharacterized protein n=1 Tax=Dreissena polymorpha TaxID=45954 RepID=A0A9D4JFI3_DREPO|nr:hypothetical protein DPMN_138327 [Dreissena polymorpha]